MQRLPPHIRVCLGGKEIEIGKTLSSGACVVIDETWWLLEPLMEQIFEAKVPGQAVSAENKLQVLHSRQLNLYYKNW